VNRRLYPLLRRARRGIAALAAALLCSIAAAASSAPTILIVGDSISAGYGLPPNSGWATLLQQRLAQQHYAYRVANASISGDTTASGRARLDTLLARERPAITVIELGGNDGLRGGSLDAMRENLDAMVGAAQKAGSRVLLVGMQLPPNYGPAYVGRFNALYGEVARARRAALVPFLFDGFADDDTLFQADRIHPVVAAQPRLLDNVWRELQPLLGAPGKTL
jgi:acyl-CoA thioesterase-1